MTTNTPRGLVRPSYMLLLPVVLLALLLIAYGLPKLLAPSTSGFGPAPVVNLGEPAAEPGGVPALIAPTGAGEQAAPNADSKLNAGRDRGSGVITGGPLSGRGLGANDGKDSTCPGGNECAP